MKRIGLLTSGGDCQGLNSALRGVAKALYNNLPDVEIFGIRDGYRGLIEGNYQKMEPADFSGILTRGGTILGTSRQPFKTMRQVDGVDKVAAMKENYNKADFHCLVILGGNGTHKTANLLSGEGLNVITLPKTIDNDIYGTDQTFGFQSACDIATLVLDSIHTTATSHSRVMIVEIMGHKVGWLTLYAGVAGGADIILLPEIPYDIRKVAEAIENRGREGKAFSIIAAAEGIISQEEAAMLKKQLKEKREKENYPALSYQLADQLRTIIGHEIRVTVPGHFQRGGSPSPSDRVLTTELGIAAAEQIIAGNFGVMMGVRNGRIVPVPLPETAGKLRRVPADHEIIRHARFMGISFGD